MPAGADATDPDPLTETESGYLGSGISSNETETARLLDIVSAQVVPDPEHAPPQLCTRHPSSGFAVSVTDVPAS